MTKYVVIECVDPLPISFRFIPFPFPIPGFYNLPSHGCPDGSIVKDGSSIMLFIL